MNTSIPTKAPARRRHAGHRRHENSLRCHRTQATGFGQRALQIRFWLTKHGPTTDRRIMEGLGFADMNTVRPRVTELLDLGLLEAVGSTNDHRTGKTVRLVRVTKGRRK